MDAQKIKAKVEAIRSLAARIENEGDMIWAVEASCGAQIQMHADEIISLIEDGKAGEVRVYDNGGTSFDRYTVFVGGDVYTMSSHPLSPQGMNQWAGKDSDFEGPNGFEISSALLREDEIPPEVREAIEQRRCSSLFNEGSQDALQALAMEDGNEGS